MSTKSIQPDTKSTQMRTDTIIIPELEEAMTEQAVTHEWTIQEEALIERYYNRVPIALLTKHLPGRTKNAIRSKAQGLGIQSVKPRSRS